MSMTLSAAQIAALPTLPQYGAWRPRPTATHPVVDVVDGYRMVVTPIAGERWTVDLYDAATTQLLATEPDLPRWASVEATLEVMPVCATHRRQGLCEWDVDCIDPCVEPVVPGSDCCVEHDHAPVLVTSGFEFWAYKCRCGEEFASRTDAEARSAHVLHALARVPRIRIDA